MRLPDHIGIIPDGNRRWAGERGLPVEKGYEAGIAPGRDMFELCREAGISEMTYYGFTTDNTKRPPSQRLAFTMACIRSAEWLAKQDIGLLVIGNTDSPMFPKELLPFTTRTGSGNGSMRVNFLVNYGWEWDLNQLKSADPARKEIVRNVKSAEISRVDLIIRWGGRRRLSGFLPVQSIYADFYVVDEYWPDFKPDHFHDALRWYQEQDVTLGG